MHSVAIRDSKKSSPLSRRKKETNNAQETLVDVRRNEHSRRATSQSVTDAVALQFRRLRDQLIDQSWKSDCGWLPD
jgi:hypothetical protein